MAKFIINGGNRISGETSMYGAKNAVLPILAASILNRTESVLHNCVQLNDIKNMIGIMEQLGCKVNSENHVTTINTKDINNWEVVGDLATEIRSSICLMGPILATFGKVKMIKPGGCEIGRRPIDLHLKALRELGVHIKEQHGEVICEAKKLKGGEIHLDYPSVGVTENIMLATATADGTTIIRNSAKEPEIYALQDYLNSIGAKVQGAGSNTICIQGVKELHATEHTIIPDRIVAGTIMVAAAITGGTVDIRNITFEHIQPVIAKLKECGCEIYIGNDYLKIKGPQRPKAISKIRTLPYPGFPTDMQAQITALLSICDGTSLVTETIFENRFKHMPELIKMGANISIEDRTAVIMGVKKLSGSVVTSEDLRGGAALVLAGLSAEGRTVVNNINHIDRGYFLFEEQLKELGADIERIN